MSVLQKKSERKQEGMPAFWGYYFQVQAQQTTVPSTGVLTVSLQKHPLRTTKCYKTKVQHAWLLCTVTAPTHLAPPQFEQYRSQTQTPKGHRGRTWGTSEGGRRVHHSPGPCSDLQTRRSGSARPLDALRSSFRHGAWTPIMNANSLNHNLSFL